MPIPARFKDAFEEGVWVTKSVLYPCVILHTKESFDEAAADIERLPRTPAGIEARRAFWEWIFEQKKDAQNRVPIEPDLQAHAGLGKDLIAVGLRNMVEVWDLATWEARAAQREAASREMEPQLLALKDQAQRSGGGIW